MNIEESVIKQCNVCFCTFQLKSNICVHCGNKEFETFWLSDDGVYLFKLISNTEDSD